MHILMTNGSFGILEEWLQWEELALLLLRSTTEGGTGILDRSSIEPNMILLDQINMSSEPWIWSTVRCITGGGGWNCKQMLILSIPFFVSDNIR